jgi:hypothetical protein
MGRPAYSLVPWTTTGTKSAPVKLDGNQVVGFILPATIASTSIKFNAATTLNVASSVTWYPINDSSGAAVSFTVNAATAGYYGFSQDQIAKFTGAELLQMVAGSSETANQAIYLIIIPRPSI